MIVMKINKASFYNILLFSSVFLLIGVRIFQIRFIPYGSPDDNALAALSYTHGSLWDGALNQAKSQGRFYQIPYVFMTQLPYLILDHQFLWIVIAVQVIMFNIGLYLAFLSIVPTKVYALFSLVIFNSLFDFRWGYNSINAFPLWFCFSLTCFLFAIRFMFLSNNSLSEISGHILRLFGISLCFVAALAYESLLYFPIILFLIDYKFWRENFQAGINSRKFVCYLKDRKGMSGSIVLFFLVYVSIYLTFRRNNPSSYPGVKFNFAEPISAASTVLKMSFAGFNSPYYFFEIDLKSFISQNFVSFVIYATIFAFFCDQILRSGRIPCYSIKYLMLVIFATLVPNLLYGFTQRYREIAQVNPLYLGALFSAPSVIFLILFVSVQLLKTPMLIRVGLITTMSLLFSLTANVNNSNITKYGDEMRSRNSTWSLVDCLLAIDPLNSSFAKVVAPDLDSAIGVPKSYRYWDYYFSTKLKNRIDFIDDPGTQAEYSKINIVEEGNFINLKYFTFNPIEGDLVLRINLAYNKKTEKITGIPKTLISRSGLKGCTKV